MEGGNASALYTPVVRGTFLEEAIKRASSTEKKANKKENILDKAIIDTLEEGGLESDTTVFLKNAEAFLKNSSNIFDLTSGEDSLGTTLSQLLALKKLANTVKNNKSAYDIAVTQMNTADSGSDVAMTSSGLMYVYNPNEDKVSTISLQA